MFPTGVEVIREASCFQPNSYLATCKSSRLNKSSLVILLHYYSLSTSQEYINIDAELRDSFQPRQRFYSQTFENRSSFPELKAAGLAGVDVDVEACGALLHPPKSSSAVTCGLVTFAAVIGAPQPLLEAAGIGAGAAAAGFESPQASLEDPHTSLLLMLAEDDEF